MFTKLYEKTKRYIKENYRFLLILLASYVLLTFPLPYYIYTTGGTIDIDDRVEVADAYQAKGSLNFAYVTELRATLPTYLLSFVIPSWESVKIDDYKMSEEETVEDVSFRDHISLDVANQSALKVAYLKAGKPFNITGSHHYIVYLDPSSVTDLKIQDEILKVDGQSITSLDEYRSIVNLHEINDTLEVVVRRNQKEEQKSIQVQDFDSVKLTGISLMTVYDYQSDPEVTLHFSKSESGPSGGLMLALSVYNKLVKEDITHGKKIVGTGTIDPDGRVGSIGGVEYKLRGAVHDHADVFLVPAGENYDDCIQLQKKEHLNIKIYAIETFEDALNVLDRLND